MNTHLARSEYHGLLTGFTKRFSNNWQASATYTLSGLWNADTKPFSGLEPVPFDTAPDLGGEWGLSSDDQRHRAVFNGIWEVGKGFQVSALHFFVAGLRLAGSWGGDLRQTGAANSATVAARRYHRPAQRVARAEAESNRRARAAADSVGRTLCDRWDRGGLQHFQQLQLRDRYGRERSIAVFAADFRTDSHGAVRVPVDVLDRWIASGHRRMLQPVFGYDRSLTRRSP